MWKNYSAKSRKPQTIRYTLYVFLFSIRHHTLTERARLQASLPIRSCCPEMLVTEILAALANDGSTFGSITIQDKSWDGQAVLPLPLMNSCYALLHGSQFVSR